MLLRMNWEMGTQVAQEQALGLLLDALQMSVRMTYPF